MPMIRYHLITQTPLDAGQVAVLDEQEFVVITTTDAENYVVEAALPFPDKHRERVNVRDYLMAPLVPVPTRSAPAAPAAPPGT